jgi:hypothetical protein
MNDHKMSITYQEKNQNSFDENLQYGWIKLYRSATDQFKGQGDLLALFCWLLAHVDRETKYAGSIKIRQSGEFKGAIIFIANGLGWSRSRVIRNLEKLKRMEIVTQKSDNKKTSISIINWDIYQKNNSTIEHPALQRPDNDRTTTGHNTRIKNKKLKTKNGGDTRAHDEPLLTPPENDVWNSYSNNYEIAYGVKPLQNSNQRRLIRQLIERVGETASGVVGYYLACRNEFYISKAHILDFCIEDAEKLSTAYQQKQLKRK